MGEQLSICYWPLTSTLSLRLRMTTIFILKMAKKKVPFQGRIKKIKFFNQRIKFATKWALIELLNPIFRSLKKKLPEKILTSFFVALYTDHTLAALPEGNSWKESKQYATVTAPVRYCTRFKICVKSRKVVDFFDQMLLSDQCLSLLPLCEFKKLLAVSEFGGRSQS